jgi:hypothetical protein
MPNLCTHYGNLPDPWALRAEDVDFRDIAYSLSNLARFVGHARPTWTVASHTLFVSDLLRRWGLSDRVQLLGLLHDASEAYLNDLTSPTKYHLWEYKDAERRALRVIYQTLGLAPASEVEERWVKDADMVALAVEAERLLPREAWMADPGWREIVDRRRAVADSGCRLGWWALYRPRFLTRRAWSRRLRELLGRLP